MREQSVCQIIGLIPGLNLPSSPGLVARLFSIASDGEGRKVRLRLTKGTRRSPP